MLIRCLKCGTHVLYLDKRKFKDVEDARNRLEELPNTIDEGYCKKCWTIKLNIPLGD